MQQQTLDNISKGMEKTKDYVFPIFYILPIGIWIFVLIQFIFGVPAAAIGFLITMFGLYHFAFYYRKSKKIYGVFEICFVDWWLAKGWPVSEKEIVKHIREIDTNSTQSFNRGNELTNEEVEMINYFCYNNMIGLFRRIKDRYSPYQKYWVFKRKSDFIAFKIKFLTK